VDVLPLSQILVMKVEPTPFWGKVMYLLSLTQNIKIGHHSFCWGLGGVAGAIIGGSCTFYLQLQCPLEAYLTWLISS
jgi:hypothetical protein